MPRLLVRTDQDRDMVIYYHAAQAASAHQDLYEAWPEYTPYMKPSRYFYAPPFAAVTAPLGRLSWQAFCYIWYALMLAAFWTFAFALSRLSGGRFTPLVCGLLVAIWPNTYFAFSIGQADVFMWALLASATACGRYRGALLAVAAIIKPIVLLPMLVVLWRDRKQVIPATGTITLALLVGALVCGLRSYGMWITEALPVPSRGTFDPDNISISFAVLRIVGYHAWAHIWLSLAALSGPCVAIYATRRKSVELQFAVVTIVSMICAPICWTSYLVVGLIPLAIIARTWPSDKKQVFQEDKAAA